MDWNSLSYNTIYWSLYCKGRREAPTLDGYMRLILYGSVQDFGVGGAKYALFWRFYSNNLGHSFYKLV